MKKILLLCISAPVYAEPHPACSPTPLVVNQDTQPQAAAPHAIHVNFSMGNSQQVPVQNQTEAKPVQVVKVEHTHTNPVQIPQETAWHRAYMSAIGGAAATVGSYAVSFLYNNKEKIIEAAKKAAGL